MPLHPAAKAHEKMGWKRGDLRLLEFKRVISDDEAFRNAVLTAVSNRCGVRLTLPALSRASDNTCLFTESRRQPRFIGVRRQGKSPARWRLSAPRKPSGMVAAWNRLRRKPLVHSI
jgi:hypothetical protein